MLKKVEKNISSSSKYFKEQIMNNLNIVCLWNFLVEKYLRISPSVKFIDSIGDTKHAKNIQLDISTNATLITEEVVNVLNKFAGGTQGPSIDSFEKEDEYIRYHTDWQSVITSMTNARKLHKGWRFPTQTTVPNVKLFDNG